MFDAQANFWVNILFAIKKKQKNKTKTKQQKNEIKVTLTSLITIFGILTFGAIEKQMDKGHSNSDNF